MPANEFLSKTHLFGGLTSDEIASILATSKERSFAPGEVVIAEGDQGRGFYMITEGTAKVVKGDETLAEIGPGNYFGEMSLLLDDAPPRVASVVAATDVTCLVMVSWDFKALLRTHPEIAVRVMAEMLHRLRADADSSLD